MDKFPVIGEDVAKKDGGKLLWEWSCLTGQSITNSMLRYADRKGFEACVIKYKLNFQPEE